jgi:hypothetical protein
LFSGSAEFAPITDFWRLVQGSSASELCFLLKFSVHLFATIKFNPVIIKSVSQTIISTLFSIAHFIACAP